MATEESNIVQRIRIAASQANNRAFRNNRGMFATMDIIDHLKAALKLPDMFQIVEKFKSVVRTARRVRAGLECPGSGDLIGWTSVTITPEMVGKNIALFTSVEVKTDDGKPSYDQINFIANVQMAGGIAGIVRSPEDYIQMVNKALDGLKK